MKSFTLRPDTSTMNINFFLFSTAKHAKRENTALRIQSWYRAKTGRLGHQLKMRGIHAREELEYHSAQILQVRSFIMKFSLAKYYHG